MPGYERYEEYEARMPRKKARGGGLLLVLLLAGIVQGFYSWQLSNRVAELERAVHPHLSSATTHEVGAAQADSPMPRIVADGLAQQAQDSTAKEQGQMER
jgi:hypothetical protein